MPVVPVPRTPPSVRLIVLLYVLFLTFHVFDAWSTVEAVRLGAIELNPLMAFLLRHGTATFLVVKMGMAAAFGLVLAATARTHRLAWYGLIGLTVVYGAVAVWHTAVVIYGERLMITVPA